jgi:hypothetical protein
MVGGARRDWRVFLTTEEAEWSRSLVEATWLRSSEGVTTPFHKNGRILADAAMEVFFSVS